jgi:hypothetical protein
MLLSFSQVCVGFSFVVAIAEESFDNFVCAACRPHEVQLSHMPAEAKANRALPRAIHLCQSQSNEAQKLCTQACNEVC